MAEGSLSSVFGFTVTFFKKRSVTSALSWWASNINLTVNNPSSFSIQTLWDPDWWFEYFFPMFILSIESLSVTFLLTMALASKKVTDSNLISRGGNDEEICLLFEWHWKHTRYHFVCSDISSHLQRQSVEKTIASEQSRFKLKSSPGRANMPQNFLFFHIKVLQWSDGPVAHHPTKMALSSS